MRWTPGRASLPTTLGLRRRERNGSLRRLLPAPPPDFLSVLPDFFQSSGVLWATPKPSLRAAAKLNHLAILLNQVETNPLLGVY